MAAPPLFGSARASAIPRSVFALMDAAKTSARDAGIEVCPPQVYKYSTVNASKLRFPQVLDLSIGSSDLSPPTEVLDALRASVLDARCHRYPLPSDSRTLQDAAARYLARRFGVTVDPATEVLPCAGAQEALVQVLFAAADPGDVILHSGEVAGQSGDPTPPHQLGARTARPVLRALPRRRCVRGPRVAHAAALP